MLIEFKVNLKLSIIGILIVLSRGEKFHDVVLGKQRAAQDSHDQHDGAIKLEVVLNRSCSCSKILQNKDIVELQGGRLVFLDLIYQLWLSKEYE